MTESKYGTVIVSEEQIKQKVRELGEQITKDYQGKKLLLVGILNGCVYFMTDLSREIDLLLEIDFMVVSSYGAATKTSGIVKIVKDLNRSIEDYDVLLVEDIIDSGLTLSYLKEYLSARNPKSIKIVTLIDKPEGRKANIQADYVGFNVPNEFIIGYGLDCAEHYRNLPYIAEYGEKENN